MLQGRWSINRLFASQKLVQIIAQNSTTTAFNSMFVSDYCYNGTTWIGYDDVQSIHTKVTYAKGKGLLGYFSWQITIGLSPN